MKKNIDFALRQLIMEGNAGTHDEICKALEKKGYTVNQPKISRMLHKLGAIKVTNANGENIYRLPHEQGLMHEVNFTGAKFTALDWIIDITNNGSLIIVHTMPGAASIVAREIDLHHIKLGILGCIAGDDTIFVAPKNTNEIRDVIEKMKSNFA